VRFDLLLSFEAFRKWFTSSGGAVLGIVLVIVALDMKANTDTGNMLRLCRYLTLLCIIFFVYYQAQGCLKSECYHQTDTSRLGC
jgi:hypothetical protein